MSSPWRFVKMARAAVRLVQDPRRLDEVIGLSDEAGDPVTVARIVDAIARTDVGAAALRDLPRIQVELAHLRTLPEGTLGRAAARFLDQRGLDPADLPRRVATDAATWVRAHVFDTHDIWHVVTGFDTDVAGELGLQAFYLAQFPARIATLLLGLGFVNTFLYGFDDRDRRMDAIARGWQLGKAARPLFGVRWGELWALPLDEVRTRLGIATADESAQPAAA